VATTKVPFFTIMDACRTKGGEEIDGASAPSIKKATI
jgi:hypothetical protein